MEQLSYAALAALQNDDFTLPSAPERVLQFGEGNFLRGFADYFVDVMNEQAGFDSKVVVVQPIESGLVDTINAQDGLYTLYLRGQEGGQAVTRRRLISAISRGINPYADFEAFLACAANPELRFIVSNTTEAGIAYDPACRPDDRPPASFPAKLAVFLHERFARGLGGVIVLSCELIDDNGKALRECVLRHAEQWHLGADFSAWLRRENAFCSTLVDRIVTGYPAAEAEELNRANGYVDKLLDTAEVFGAWVIEGDESIGAELPFGQAGLPITLTSDIAPYKQRKVRILNGAHTSLVLGALLAGKTIVRECMHDEVCLAFLKRALFDEIIPTLDLPRADLESFAGAVLDRFANPHIDHKLADIALNSTSKWRARVLPSATGYVAKFGAAPGCLAFSFAALLAYYQAGLGRDEQWVLDWFAEHALDDPGVLVAAACANERLWGRDLNDIPGFAAAVLGHLAAVKADPVAALAQAGRGHG
ncbi:MAG: tagaturonate reductase [Propionibacteriaceae bacterium]|nr:tagaturonate reductase [Propionibacteriaceae bacterium]